MEAPEAEVIRQHLIDPEICIRCNTCESTCPVGAITHDARNYVVDASICNLCMACVPPCPTGSIDNWRAMPRAQAYSVTMYVLAGLLAVGFVCNLLITPVPKKYYMTMAQLNALDKPTEVQVREESGAAAAAAVSPTWLVYAAWVPVAVPLLWAVWVTLQKAALIFSQG